MVDAGSVSIAINGTTDDLEDALNDAVSLAEDKAQEIEDAFQGTKLALPTDEIIADFETLMDSADEVGDRIQASADTGAESLRSLGQAGEEAAQGVSSAGENAAALDEVASGADQASSSMWDMVAAGAAIGAGVAAFDAVVSGLEDIYAAIQNDIQGYADLNDAATRAAMSGGTTQSNMASATSAITDQSLKLGRQYGTSASDVAGMLGLLRSYNIDTSKMSDAQLNQYMNMAVGTMNSPADVAKTIQSTTELYKKSGLTAQQAMDIYSKAYEMIPSLDPTQLGGRGKSALMTMEGSKGVSQALGGFTGELALLETMKQVAPQAMPNMIGSTLVSFAANLDKASDATVKSTTSAKGKVKETVVAAKGLAQYLTGTGLTAAGLQAEGPIKALEDLYNKQQTTGKDLFTPIFGAGNAGMALSIAQNLPQVYALKAGLEDAAGADTDLGQKTDDLSRALNRGGETFDQMGHEIGKVVAGPAQDWSNWLAGPGYDAFDRFIKKIQSGDIKGAFDSLAQDFENYDWSAAGEKAGQNLVSWFASGIANQDAGALGNALATLLNGALVYVEGAGAGLNWQDILFGKTPLDSLLKPLETVLGDHSKLAADTMKLNFDEGTIGAIQAIYDFHDSAVGAIAGVIASVEMLADAFSGDLVGAINGASQAAGGFNLIQWARTGIGASQGTSAPQVNQTRFSVAANPNGDKSVLGGPTYIIMDASTGKPMQGSYGSEYASESAAEKGINQYLQSHPNDIVNAPSSQGATSSVPTLTVAQMSQSSPYQSTAGGAFGSSAQEIVPGSAADKAIGTMQGGSTVWSSIWKPAIEGLVASTYNYMEQQDVDLNTRLKSPVGGAGSFTPITTTTTPGMTQYPPATPQPNVYTPKNLADTQVKTDDLGKSIKDMGTASDQASKFAQYDTDAISKLGGMWGKYDSDKVISEDKAAIAADNLKISTDASTRALETATIDWSLLTDQLNATLSGAGIPAISTALGNLGSSCSTCGGAAGSCSAQVANASVGFNQLSGVVSDCTGCVMSDFGKWQEAQTDLFRGAYIGASGDKYAAWDQANGYPPVIPARTGSALYDTYAQQGISRESNGQVLNLDTGSYKQQTDAMLKDMSAKSATIKTDADTTPALASANQAVSTINGMSATITVGIDVVGGGGGSAGSNGGGLSNLANYFGHAGDTSVWGSGFTGFTSQYPTYASGGPTPSRATAALVGEEGEEYVVPHGGALIKGGGKPSVIENHYHFDGILIGNIDELANKIAKIQTDNNLNR